MLTDYEQELTTAIGHDTDFAPGSEYGSKPYDLKGSHDSAVGEPLQAFMQILSADVDGPATLQIDIVNDDDGAGGNEVVVATRTFANAALTVADGVRRIGFALPGLSKLRYLTAKLTIAGGTPASTALCRVWLAKGTDMVPQNEGTDIA